MKNVPPCEEMANPPKGPIDFAIVTALRIERDAVLQLLENCCKIQDDSDSLTYYYGHITIPRKNERYKVVVVMQLGMGNNIAAVTTSKIIQHWQPKHLIMVGIAGGVRNKVSLGDVVVADFCHYYESAKAQPGGEQRRPRQFPSNRLLYGRASAYNSNEWHSDIRVAPPETLITPDSPKIYFGPIASGEQVIADQDVLAKLLQECPQLLAVAMEGAGVASASTHHDDTIRFIEIRGICDFADEQKNDAWQPFAANVVAAYTIGFLRSRPVPPLSPPVLPLSPPVLPQASPPVLFVKTQWANLLWLVGGLVKSTWNSFFWFVLTLFFGLLQGWLVLGTNLFIPGNNPVFIKFLIEGAVPFFSIAVISSLAIDYCVFSLGTSCCLRNPWTFFMFFMVPAIIIFLGVILFLYCYFTPAEKIDIDWVFKLEFAIFSVTFVHAMIVKSVAFFKEECVRFNSSSKNLTFQLRPNGNSPWNT